MGVEASRRALAVLDGERPTELLFSTPAPAYLDKTNATAIHAALGLSEFGGAYDLIGSVRSAVGAFRRLGARRRYLGLRTPHDGGAVGPAHRVRRITRRA